MQAARPYAEDRSALSRGVALARHLDFEWHYPPEAQHASAPAAWEDVRPAPRKDEAHRRNDRAFRELFFA
jgi:hypothetical protein